MRALKPAIQMKSLPHFGSALLVVAVSFVSATGAAAQGCCSAAPSAGPGSVSGQGVGSLFPGQGWIQASVFSLSTGEQFGITGVEETYFNEGHLDLQSFVLTGAVGLVTGLEVWAQGTVHSLEFRDAGGSLSRKGLGDMRVWLRAEPSLFGVNKADLPLWLGLRAEVKVPGSEFPLDSRVIPLTEGQKTPSSRWSWAEYSRKDDSPFKRGLVIDGVAQTKPSRCRQGRSGSATPRWRRRWARSKRCLPFRHSTVLPMRSPDSGCRRADASCSGSFPHSPRTSVLDPSR